MSVCDALERKDLEAHRSESQSSLTAIQHRSVAALAAPPPAHSLHSLALIHADGAGKRSTLRTECICRETMVSQQKHGRVPVKLTEFPTVYALLPARAVLALCSRCIRSRLASRKRPGCVLRAAAAAERGHGRARPMASFQTRQIRLQERR